MATDFSDDWDLVYSSGGEFATAATLTISNATSTVYGIFDKAHQALDVENVAVTSAGPRYRCQSALVSSFNRKTDTVTISSVVYKVKAIEPIGTGEESYLVLSVD